MSTVAEGIETEAQAAVVRQLGCQRGQGFLFSKPLAAADIPAWLTHNALIPA
jgi:EAL domain-containing protein (putative c-di-GMP-specific phosphodiesterase class I)